MIINVENIEFAIAAYKVSGFYPKNCPASRFYFTYVIYVFDNRMVLFKIIFMIL